jgi:hypothetical protein
MNLIELHKVVNLATEFGWRRSNDNERVASA